MGKKSILSSVKNSRKHEKKQQINSLVKILRPKVYITDTSNFKRLVQELTGNGKFSPVSSPLPSVSVASPPSTGVPLMDSIPDLHHAHREDNSLDLSFDSYSYTPLEGSSPDFGLPADSFNYVNMKNSQQVDFSLQDMDLESFLLGLDSVSCNSYACHGMNTQQEVCL